MASAQDHAGSHPPGSLSLGPQPSAASTQSSEKLNILLVGGGGREHALARLIAQSPKCGTLFATDMSNPGIAQVARAMDIPFDMKDSFRLQRWCATNNIGLAVIGPEEPLAMGLADLLKGSVDEMGLTGGLVGGAVKRVFGPSKQAAQLEADKAFAKEIMRGSSVPTAEGRVFTDFASAQNFLDSRTEAHVIKACGLAKGKGVFVPSSKAEGISALDRIMVKKEFGQAGAKVLIEERLKGREVSVFALVDGRNIYMLDSCQDHKRLKDGAFGPNTGGMGALCPSNAIDDKLMARIEREILVPTIDGLKREGIEYKGVLYAGIMLTPAGPKVLEFNCRFGDPECQVLMARWGTDIIDSLSAVCDGTLDQLDLRWKGGASVCVVLAADGYPDAPRKGAVIEGIDRANAIEGVSVIHAGTARTSEGKIVVNGGRVLGVTAVGDDVNHARERAYRAVKEIRFPGMQVRSDIGTDVIG